MKIFWIRHRKKIIPFLICLVLCPVFLIPLIMMILGSFKTQGEALHMDLSLPSHFQFENYLHVIQTGEILRGYKQPDCYGVFCRHCNYTWLHDGNYNFQTER